jgi:hypothetical protein
MKRKLNWPIIACLLLWAAVLVLLLSSCSRSVYVPVETVRVDTFVKTAVRVDSVRLTDSVYVSERTVGDTVYIVKTRTQWRDRLQLRVDTVYRSQTDTITKVVEVVVEKKAKRRKMWPWLLGALAVGVVFFTFASLLSRSYFRR